MHGNSGRRPWNKNLTKETDPRVAIQSQKISISMKIVSNRLEMKKKRKEVINRPEVKEKLRVVREGKSYEEIMGVEKAEETKKKLSESQEGKHLSEETKDKLRKPKSEKTKAKMKVAKSGKNNPNWQGGDSGDYPFEFNEDLKEYIRKRDNNTCQLCGMIEKESLERWNERLSIHHVNHDKYDSFELNLITLCRSCNSIVDYNRNRYEDYFTYLLYYGIFWASSSWVEDPGVGGSNPPLPMSGD